MFISTKTYWFQQNTAMVTPLMARMASWLTPLLLEQELAATLTLMMMSSGHSERDKVGPVFKEASLRIRCSNLTSH